MRIKSLSLENIRSYVKQTVLFPKGTILLSGDIGCGKSTILQSIEFALFGIVRGEFSGASLLRYGEKKGEVTLEFVLDNKTYGVTRGLQRTKLSVAQTTGKLIQDGVVEELSAQELTNKLFTILAYPMHYSQKSQSLLYRYTVYTSQEKMKEILFESTDSRLQILRALFGVEKYKTISANAQLVGKELRVKKAFVEGTIADKAELQTRHAELTQRNESLGKELSVLIQTIMSETTSFEKAKAEYEAVSESYETLRRFEETKMLLTKRKSELEQKQSSLNVELKKTIESAQKTQLEHDAIKLTSETINLVQLRKEKEQLQQDVFKQREALLTFQNTKRNLLSEQTQLQKETAELTQLSGQLLQKQTQQNDLQSKLLPFESLKESLRSYETALESLKIRHAQITERLAQTNQTTHNLTAHGTCPTCLQQITAEHKVHTLDQIEQKKKDDEQMALVCEKTRSQLEDKITTAKQSIDELTKVKQQFDSLAVEVELLKKRLVEKTQIEESLATCMRKIAELKEPPAIVDTTKHVGELEEKIAQGEKNQAAASRKEQLAVQLSYLENDKSRIVEELTQIKKDHGEITAQLQTLSEKLSQLEQHKLQVAKAKEQLTTQQTHLLTLKTQQTKLESDKTHGSLELAKVEELLTKRKSQEALRNKIITYDNWIKSDFVPLMQTVERAVFTSAYQECQAAFSRWFSLVLPDETLNAQLDENFTPKITQDGYETELSQLSGGEKTSIALVYRLALNHVINQVVSTIKTRDLLILDEPTDGFSTEQLDRVKDVLDQLRLEQLIIVSHEQKVESFVDSVIRVEKKNQVSVVSQV